MSLGSNTPGNRMKAMQSSTFLSRLRRDQKGNALAMVAASIIPLVGAIGGGVDLTRAYMAEARLAQACDAAALAGRKVMMKDDVDSGGTVRIDSTAGQEIQRFLNYNFPEGKFSTGEIDKTAQVDSEGELTITLATTMPTQLLKIAGIRSIDINAECSAKRSGVNVDVVLVLDVTGSMGWSIGGSSDGSNERILALQTASKSFLDILNDLQDQLESSGLRVRVGIVPYSQGVNVGKLLYAEDPSYLDWSGESYATDLGSTYTRTMTTRSGGKTYYYKTNTTPSGGYQNVSLDLDEFVSNGLAEETPTNPYAWKGCVEARATVTTIDASSSPYTTIPSGAWDVIDAAPGEIVDGLTAPKWRPFFASPWASGNQWGPSNDTSKMTLSKAPWNQVHWEKKTSNATSEGAIDMATLTYARSALGSSDYVGGKSTKGPNAPCPDEAKLLTQIDTDGVSTLSGYVDALKPNGGTYHDLGMYWGLALISPGAPFTNASTYLASGHTGTPPGVNRYIVFMSDGEIDPATSYTAYSKYNWDHRTRSNTYEPKAEHRARFRMICEAAKRQGIEVSTVAFSTSIGTTDKDAIRDCASSEDNYYLAETAEDLNEAFEKIAQNIGYLRVSK